MMKILFSVKEMESVPCGLQPHTSMKEQLNTLSIQRNIVAIPSDPVPVMYMLNVSL
jgi:hypothetical protein